MHSWDLHQMTDSLKSPSRLQVLLHPALGTGLSGSLASLLAGEDMPVSRKLAGNSCRFIKQGESPGMADHESESNQGCLLFDLSFLARSRADGTGCLCMLNDWCRQLLGKGSSPDPLFGSPVCAPCLTQGDLLPPITYKDRVRLQGAILVFRESMRGQETTVKCFSQGALEAGGGNHNLLPRFRVTSGSEPHGLKKHRGVDQCHSTRMNMGTSSWIHWHSQGLLPSVILITNPQNWYESHLKPDKKQQH